MIVADPVKAQPIVFLERPRLFMPERHILGIWAYHEWNTVLGNCYFFLIHLNYGSQKMSREFIRHWHKTC